MSEEIIIDGVNVAECHNKTPYKNDYGDVQCKCYRFEDIENDTFLFGICKQHPNCYYKQLKRLQAENKRLKDAIKSINKPVFLPNIEQEATNKYRKALEEIRAYVQTLKKKKSSFYTINDVLTDIAQKIENKINEVLKDERN